MGSATHGQLTVCFFRGKYRCRHTMGFMELLKIQTPWYFPAEHWNRAQDLSPYLAPHPETLISKDTTTHIFLQRLSTHAAKRAPLIRSARWLHSFRILAT